MSPIAPAPAKKKGAVARIKERLGEAYSLFQEVSKQFQRGTLSAEDYYDTAVDILQGDAELLMELVSKLPVASKREAVQACHAAAVSEMAEQMALRDIILQDAPRPAPPQPPRAAPPKPAPSTASSESPASFPAASQGASSSFPPASQAAASAFPTLTESASGSKAVATRAAGGADGAWGCKAAGEAYARSNANAHADSSAGVHADADARPHAQGAANEAEEHCPVCMDEEPNVRLKPCGHLLCRGCLDLWKQRGGPAPGKAATSCPLCRTPVKSHKHLRSARKPGAAAQAATVRSGQTAGPDGRNAGTAPSSRAAGSPSPAASSTAPIIVWLRRDLRLEDQPAFHYAARSRRPVVPIFIWAPQELGAWGYGAAARWWIEESLRDVDASLSRRGSARLQCFDARGRSSAAVLDDVISSTGADAVAWSRLYEPWCLERDSAIERDLAARGISVHTFNSSLLYEPWDALPDQGDNAIWNSGYGSVRFFLNGCARLGDPAEPLPAPASICGLPPAVAGQLPGSCGISALGLADLPVKGRKTRPATGELWERAAVGQAIDWTAGMRAEWPLGESGAAVALEGFLTEGIHHFETRSAAPTLRSTQYVEEDHSAPPGGRGAPRAPAERFRADRKFTARISPYMAWGNIGPRQVYHAVRRRAGGRNANTFLRRLAWRDLAYWALWRFPTMLDRAMRPQYEHQRWDHYWKPDAMLRSLKVTKQRWRSDEPRVQAWQRGETGFPLVDAGMKELWVTGYMPNYVRHIVAGFLVEYLNADWRIGALWFHDTLLDADPAINAMMWQNGGHSGMDQWNFVMHPVFAAKSADPEGDYVRRWLPQLAKLPVEFIHCPWEAPVTALAAAGVRLGRNYPKRILTNLEAARTNSLDAVVEMRRGAGAKYILPDGNDALPLPDGRFARAITRVDYREMAEEPLTRQSAAEAWDKSKRPSRDPLARAMREGMASRMAAAGERDLASFG